MSRLPVVVYRLLLSNVLVLSRGVSIAVVHFGVGQISVTPFGEPSGVLREFHDDLFTLGVSYFADGHRWVPQGSVSVPQ